MHLLTLVDFSFTKNFSSLETAFLESFLSQGLAELAGEPVLPEDIEIVFSSPARLEFEMLVVSDRQDVPEVLESHSASNVSEMCSLALCRFFDIDFPKRKKERVCPQCSAKAAKVSQS